MSLALPPCNIYRRHRCTSFVVFTTTTPIKYCYYLTALIPYACTRIDKTISRPINYDSFQSVHEELEYYKKHAQELEETLAETRYTLEEFQLSSKELEEELEKEIDSTERRYNEIKIRNEAMRQEVDDWKVTIIHVTSDDFFLFFLLAYLQSYHSISPK